MGGFISILINSVTWLWNLITTLFIFPINLARAIWSFLTSAGSYILFILPAILLILTALVVLEIHQPVLQIVDDAIVLLWTPLMNITIILIDLIRIAWNIVICPWNLMQLNYRLFGIVMMNIMLDCDVWQDIFLELVNAIEELFTFIFEWFGNLFILDFDARIDSVPFWETVGDMFVALGENLKCLCGEMDFIVDPIISWFDNENVFCILDGMLNVPWMFPRMIAKSITDAARPEINILFDEICTIICCFISYLNDVLLTIINFFIELINLFIVLVTDPECILDPDDDDCDTFEPLTLDILCPWCHFLSFFIRAIQIAVDGIIHIDIFFVNDGGDPYFFDLPLDLVYDEIRALAQCFKELLGNITECFGCTISDFILFWLEWFVQITELVQDGSFDFDEIVALYDSFIENFKCMLLEAASIDPGFCLDAVVCYLMHFVELIGMFLDIFNELLELDWESLDGDGVFDTIRNIVEIVACWILDTIILWGQIITLCIQDNDLIDLWDNITTQFQTFKDQVIDCIMEFLESIYHFANALAVVASSGTTTEIEDAFNLWLDDWISIINCIFDFINEIFCYIIDSVVFADITLGNPPDNGYSIKECLESQDSLEACICYTIESILETVFEDVDIPCPAKKRSEMPNTGAFESAHKSYGAASGYMNSEQQQVLIDRWEQAIETEEYDTYNWLKRLSGDTDEEIATTTNSCDYMMQKYTVSDYWMMSTSESFQYTMCVLLLRKGHQLRRDTGYDRTDFYYNSDLIKDYVHDTTDGINGMINSILKTTAWHKLQKPLNNILLDDRADRRKNTNTTAIINKYGRDISTPVSLRETGIFSGNHQATDRLSHIYHSYNIENNLSRTTIKAIDHFIERSGFYQKIIGSDDNTKKDIGDGYSYPGSTYVKVGTSLSKGVVALSKSISGLIKGFYGLHRGFQASGVYVRATEHGKRILDQYLSSQEVEDRDIYETAQEEINELRDNMEKGGTYQNGMDSGQVFERFWDSDYQPTHHVIHRMGRLEYTSTQLRDKMLRMRRLSHAINLYWNSYKYGVDYPVDPETGKVAESVPELRSLHKRILNLLDVDCAFVTETIFDVVGFLFECIPGYDNPLIGIPPFDKRNDPDSTAVGFPLDNKESLFDEKVHDAQHTEWYNWFVYNYTSREYREWLKNRTIGENGRPYEPIRPEVRKVPRHFVLLPPVYHSREWYMTAEERGYESFEDIMNAAVETRQSRHTHSKRTNPVPPKSFTLSGAIVDAFEFIIELLFGAGTTFADLYGYLFDFFTNFTTDINAPEKGFWFYLSFHFICRFPESLNCTYGLGLTNGILVSLAITVGLLILSGLIFGSGVTSEIAIYILISFIPIVFAVSFGYSFVCTPAAPICFADEFVLLLEDMNIGCIPIFGGFFGTDLVCPVVPDTRTFPYNCAADIGFEDGFDNLAFIIAAWLPDSIYEFLLGTGTDIPILSDIMELIRDNVGFVSATLQRFDYGSGVTPPLEDFHCFWITILNLVALIALAALVGYLLFVLLPPVLSLFFSLLRLLFRLFGLFAQCCCPRSSGIDEDLMYALAMYSDSSLYPEEDEEETDEEEDEEDEEEEEETEEEEEEEEEKKQTDNTGIGSQIPILRNRKKKKKNTTGSTLNNKHKIKKFIKDLKKEV